MSSQRLQTGMFLALLLVAVPAGGEVTTLLSVADTFISSRNPSHNMGGHDHAAVGRDNTGNRRRGLCAFDLSGIPADATITSATLRLTVVIEPIPPKVDSNFKLFRLTKNWGEGVGMGNNGSPASSGEATWVSAEHMTSSWNSEGAAGDYLPIPSASQFVDGPINQSFVWETTQMVADVQQWVEVPASNFGWILISGNESTNKSVKAFASREAANVNIRPSLTVGYRFASAPPPTVTGLERVPGGLVLRTEADNKQLLDMQISRGLAASSDWDRVAVNLSVDPTGSNLWSEVPFLATPEYLGNTNLAIRYEGWVAPTQRLAIGLSMVETNLVSPVALTHAGDGTGRKFVADQTGPIVVLDRADNLLPAPFLDLTDRLTNLTVFAFGGNTEPGINPRYDERGLLGMAFHPGYETNGRFFVYYSTDGQDEGMDHRTVLSEFTVSSTNANQADPASEREILSIQQPEFNHNGGAIAFGPDGSLYLGLGDGGGAGDEHPPFGNGQDTRTLLGSIVRLDVDGAFPYEVPPDNPFIANTNILSEIYALGFRNPWRFSFDRGGSNQLFVADVGQALWEEVNIVEPGVNYGWRILEGSYAYDPDLADTLGLDPATFGFPIHEYRHGPLGISVIGGHVYRGSSLAGLTGHYVFGDFSTSFGSPDGALYYLAETRPGIWQRFEFILPGGERLGEYLKGFGEDEAGEMYVLVSTSLGPSGTSGKVLRIINP